MKTTKLTVLLLLLIAAIGGAKAQPNACTGTFNYTVYAPQQVQFIVQHDSFNTPGVTYTWTFGDTTILEGNAVHHQFAADGDYDVCVNIASATCTYTFCDTIHVGVVPAPTYLLSGYVYKGANNTCSAIAYLISDSAGYLSVVAKSEKPDSNSVSCWKRFNFSGVPEGYYYLKAAVDTDDFEYASYLPTYYGGAVNWADATPIHVTAHDYSLHVNLVAGVNPGGPGFVGGWVYEGAGLTIGGGNESRANGDPVAGIQINLVTENDMPVAASVTDANGRYTFSNLALGTYKVYAEQINKVPYAMSVTLDANNQSQDNVNVLVNSNSAVTGVDDMLDISITGVYPNPVTDKTSVAVTMKQSTKVTMTLTDVNGRTIKSRNLELVTGTNEIKLDMNGEAAGVYHMNLTSGNDKKIIRLVKVN
ncbi:MAG TPA: T9SS type A sorting domain-containing protein [Chitinophagales bacterium]|nr:T9SS type A sorting domain-containing protein [Chitinophagales bacterium]